MVKCEECNKKLGVSPQGYRHPVLGTRFLLCRRCFTMIKLKTWNDGINFIFQIHPTQNHLTLTSDQRGIEIYPTTLFYKIGLTTFNLDNQEYYKI